MNNVTVSSKNYTPTKFDKNIIYFAKTLALKSKVKGKHASIVVNSNGDIESIGINHHHPSGYHGPTSSVHAECAALRNINTKVFFLMIRRPPRSTPACIGHSFSKPCDDCMREILSRKVNTVIYTNGGVNDWESTDMVIMNIGYP
jgi:deoxycytidylate deaminase